MRISEFLSTSDCLVDVRTPDKQGLLGDLSHRASAALGLDFEIIVDSLQKREQPGSTGVGEGVAIPHARFPNLKTPFGVFARLKQAIKFDAVDGKAVDLVFLLLLPPGLQGSHLQALAAVARKLRDPEAQKMMRQAGSGDELYCIICDTDRATTQGP